METAASSNPCVTVKLVTSRAPPQSWNSLATISLTTARTNPVRFSVLARPSNGSKPPSSQESSADHVSASSTFSYAHSLASSSFTLSSGTTDNSSASSALFDGKPREEPGNNVFALQLKKLYRSISALESKILSEDTDDNPNDSRVLLHPRARDVSDKDLEHQW